jgi:hypothetical protein
LACRDTEIAQGQKLLFRFDSLCNDCAVCVSAEPHHCCRERTPSWIPIDSPSQAYIELDECRHDFQDVPKARVPGPSISDGYAHTH